MGIVILLYSVVLVFSLVCCRHPAGIDEPGNTDNEDGPIIPAMYKPYTVSESVLQEANLPIVKIQTKDNAYIESKDEWIDAVLEITNADIDDWNLEPIDISIRGRGNTSWAQAKKPFAIKLNEKTSVCGMPKHKRWVLIANYLDMSFMKNEMAFFLSRQLCMDYTVRGEYVNLVLNGNFVGLYWLGEQIKVDKNRVNINEENDYLIEMDVYYDELWKFKTDIKQLPVMIKNDEYMTDDKLAVLQNFMNQLESVLYSPSFPEDDTFTSLIDIDSFAKFYLVNEIMHNGELNHPKSCYFTFKTDDTILRAGPVWDFDWSAGTTNTALSVCNSLYYDALLKTDAFTTKLNELLSDNDFSPENVSLQIENLRNKISKSAYLDGERWGTDCRNPDHRVFDSFDRYVDDLKLCLTTKLSALKNTSF